MAKINYSKVEMALVNSLDKMFLQNLTELAAIATQANEGSTPLDTEEVNRILKSFRIELIRLKKNDPALYEQLDLSEEQEKHLVAPSKNFTREDWLKLIDLNARMIAIDAEKTKNRLDQRINELNADKVKDNVVVQADEEIVAKERLEHKNKRFNVRKGWLPLH